MGEKTGSTNYLQGMWVNELGKKAGSTNIVPLHRGRAAEGGGGFLQQGNGAPYATWYGSEWRREEGGGEGEDDERVLLLGLCTAVVCLGGEMRMIMMPEPVNCRRG